MGLGGWGSKFSGRWGIRQAEGLEVAEEEGIPGKQTLKPPEPQSWKECVGEAGVSTQVKCSSLPLIGLFLICPV